MKRPSGYNDWRRLYQREIQALGFIAQTYLGMKFERQKNWPAFLLERCARSCYVRIDRIRRLQLRLDACREANDPEAVDALLNLIFNEPPEE